MEKIVNSVGHLVKSRGSPRQIKFLNSLSTERK